MAAQRQGIRAGYCTLAAWLIPAVFLMLAACLMLAGTPARAAPASEGGAFLTGEITVTQATALVGSTMRWSVALTPLTDVPITAVTFEPLDAALWAGPVEAPALDTLEASRQVVLDMIPLVTGEIRPALLVRFMVDDVPFSAILTGESHVEIVPVTAQLDAWLTIPQGSLRQGQEFPARLWIQNNTPFVLTLTDLAPDGTDSLLTEAIPEPELPARATTPQDLVLRLAGSAPRPAFLLTFRWEDAAGQVQHAALRVEGAAVLVEPSKLARVTDSPIFDTLLGILVGAVATFAAGAVVRRQQRNAQQAIDQAHMRGMLRLAAQRADRATLHGESIDLKLLENLYQDDALYDALQRDDLAQDTQDLIAAIDSYNRGLRTDGGGQRTADVRRIAGALQKRLQ